MLWWRTKIYICKYCRKKYSKTIPKLNKENYIIENITSNCEHGNGVRYISELPLLIKLISKQISRINIRNYKS